MQLKNITILFTILIILSTPLVLYLNSTFLLVFSPRAYVIGFQRNNVYKNFHNISIPDETAVQIINYFKGNQKSLPDLFNQNEKDHLRDVKLLLDRLEQIYFSLLVVMLICITLLYRFFKNKFWKSIHRTFTYGSLLTILLTLLLILFSLNFDKIFTQFHLVFFPQGNWMFPLESNLIRLFPKSFFFEEFVFIVILTLTQSFLLLLISSLINSKKRVNLQKTLIKKHKIFK